MTEEILIFPSSSAVISVFRSSLLAVNDFQINNACCYVKQGDRPVFMAKIIKYECVAEPIMTFGGSPTIVPETANIGKLAISAIKVGIGVTWIRRQKSSWE